MSAAAGAPRVVALLPAWNSATFIEPTLESLAAQTYGNLEVLISDDASSDGTAELCTRFVAGRPQFQLTRQTRRQGWIGNVNALLRQARAEYLFFAFHDDPLKPTYVASLVEALQNNPRAVLAFSDIELGPAVRSYTELDGVSERLERARRIIRKQGLWWIPNRGLFRSEAATRIGGMHRHLAGEYSADWPWLLGLGLLGEFTRVPRPLIRKVWRNDGVSMSWKGTHWQAVGVAVACAEVITRAGIPLTERLSLYRELGGRGMLGLVSRMNRH
jgi:glycosyltransferase involved in cell wall biosynthesis